MCPLKGIAQCGPPHTCPGPWGGSAETLGLSLLALWKWMTDSPFVGNPSSEF